jgi:hypothetical protein
LLYCVSGVGGTLIVFFILSIVCIYKEAERYKRSQDAARIIKEEGYPLEGIFRPCINYKQRKADFDIENKVIQNTSIGPLTIVKRFPAWSFDTYECQWKRDGVIYASYCIIYGTNDYATVHSQIRDETNCDGAEHPMVQMFKVYRRLNDKDIAPKAFCVSDPSAYEAPGDVSYEDRFLVVEAIRDRFMDRFMYGKIDTPKMFRAFISGLIDVVDIIQRLHAENIFTRNIHIGSFVYRKRGDKLVIWDLCCSARGNMEYHALYFNDDLSIIIQLIHNGLRTGDAYRDTRIVSDEFRKSVSDIYTLAMRTEGTPAYDEIKQLLRKHL